MAKIWFAGTVSPMQEDSVIYVAATSQNESGWRKRSGDSMRNSRIRWKSAQPSSESTLVDHQEVRNATACWWKAQDYAIFWWTRAGALLTGTQVPSESSATEEEIVGKEYNLLFLLEDQRRGVPEQVLRKAAEEDRAEDERWHVRKDSTHFWASGVVRAVRDEEGESAASPRSRAT